MDDYKFSLEELRIEFSNVGLDELKSQLKTEMANFSFMHGYHLKARYYSDNIVKVTMNKNIFLFPKFYGRLITDRTRNMSCLEGKVVADSYLFWTSIINILFPSVFIFLHLRGINQNFEIFDVLILLALQLAVILIYLISLKAFLKKAKKSLVEKLG